MEILVDLFSVLALILAVVILFKLCNLQQLARTDRILIIVLVISTIIASIPTITSFFQGFISGLNG